MQAYVSMCVWTGVELLPYRDFIIVYKARGVPPPEYKGPEELNKD